MKKVDKELDIMQILNIKLKTILAITTSHIILPRDWFSISEKDNNGVVKVKDIATEKNDYISSFLKSYDFIMILRRDRIIICKSCMKDCFSKTINL